MPVLSTKDLQATLCQATELVSEVMTALKPMAIAHRQRFQYHQHRNDIPKPPLTFNQVIRATHLCTKTLCHITAIKKTVNANGYWTVDAMLAKKLNQDHTLALENIEKLLEIKKDLTNPLANNKFDPTHQQESDRELAPYPDQDPDQAIQTRPSEGASGPLTSPSSSSSSSFSSAPKELTIDTIRNAKPINPKNKALPIRSFLRNTQRLQKLNNKCQAHQQIIDIDTKHQIQQEQNEEKQQAIAFIKKLSAEDDPNTHPADQLELDHQRRDYNIYPPSQQHMVTSQPTLRLITHPNGEQDFITVTNPLDGNPNKPQKPDPPPHPRE